MRLRLIPRDEGFFELFTKAAENADKGAHLLRDLFANYDRRESLREQVRQVEHDGDEITHLIMRRLNTIFVTPFDREDIHQLASELDDVLDHIDAAADYLVLHNIAEPIAELAQQTDVLVRATETTVEAIQKLRKLKGLESYWVELNRLENEGDTLYRRTIATLFSGDYKAMDVLKHKDVLEEIEAAIDSIEDIANTIEAIVLKHA